MPRLAIVLPIMAARFAKRDLAEDSDAVVHLLALQLVMHVTEIGEQFAGKDVVCRLRLLKAKDVRLLLPQQTLDDSEPGSNGVHVPGCDLDLVGHDQALSPFCIPRK